VNRDTEREVLTTMTIVGDEMLHRRALEHRARWEAEIRAQARAEEEARANEAAARRLAEEGTRSRAETTPEGANRERGGGRRASVSHMLHWGGIGSVVFAV